MGDNNIGCREVMLAEMSPAMQQASRMVKDLMTHCVENELTVMAHVSETADDGAPVCIPIAVGDLGLLLFGVRIIDQLVVDVLTHQEDAR